MLSIKWYNKVTGDEPVYQLTFNWYLYRISLTQITRLNGVFFVYTLLLVDNSSCIISYTCYIYSIRETHKTLLQKNMKTKIIKAYELAMKGYTTEEIASSLMLIFKLHYKQAKTIAIRGMGMTYQVTEN